MIRQDVFDASAGGSKVSHFHADLTAHVKEIKDGLGAVMHPYYVITNLKFSVNVAVETYHDL